MTTETLVQANNMLQIIAYLEEFRTKVVDDEIYKKSYRSDAIKIIEIGKRAMIDECDRLLAQGKAALEAL